LEEVVKCTRPRPRAGEISRASLEGWAGSEGQRLGSRASWGQGVGAGGGNQGPACGWRQRHSRNSSSQEELMSSPSLLALEDKGFQFKVTSLS
jgi:hypothetical protein